MNTICFSRALGLAGRTFEPPNLGKFMKHWFRIVQVPRESCNGERKLGSPSSLTLQPGDGVSGNVKNK